MKSLAQIIRQKQREKKLFYSFELVWNNKKDNENVYKKFFEDIQDLSPLFYAFASPSENRYSASLIANSTTSLPIFDHSTLLHLIARTLTENDAIKFLDEALNSGVTNVLAVRGDNISTAGDFNYTLDVVRFIKKHYDNKFCIAVAGYPDKHPESPSREHDFNYLKQKIDAGAHFIISQVVFDAENFIKFVTDCKNYGINVPIIAGIMPVISYTSTMRMVSKCKLTIPPSVYDDLEKWKDNDMILHQYGVTLISTIIKEIIASECTYGFHFFTLNQSSVICEIFKKLQ